jgi:hypothetical protein
MLLKTKKIRGLGLYLQLICQGNGSFQELKQSVIIYKMEALIMEIHNNSMPQ